jgi:hypothetical protein
VSEWTRRRRASPPRAAAAPSGRAGDPLCAPAGPGGRADDEHPTAAYAIVGRREVRLGVTAVREVRGIEQELAAARPRPGSGETELQSVQPEPRERRLFASEEPGL